MRQVTGWREELYTQFALQQRVEEDARHNPPNYTFCSFMSLPLLMSHKIAAHVEDSHDTTKTKKGGESDREGAF